MDNKPRIAYSDLQRLAAANRAALLRPRPNAKTATPPVEALADAVVTAMRQFVAARMAKLEARVAALEAKED